MAKMSDLSEEKDLAICLVINHHSKSAVNDEFKFCVNKIKTVHHFMHMVSKKFGLDVGSFYLMSERNSSSKTKTLNKIKLTEHDNRLMSEIGLVSGKNTVNRFLLNEIDHSDSNIALCTIHISKHYVVYSFFVDKNMTCSIFYKLIARLCNTEGYNTDHFHLIFDSNIETSKCIINEDDTRLLCDIGVVFRREVRNLFKIFLDDQHF